MSRSILSPLGFSMSSRDEGGFPRTGSSHSEHNAARSVTMSKRRVIRSSSVIGCNDKKKKFATRTRSGEMFLRFPLRLASGLDSGDLASCCSRVFMWIFLKYSSLICIFIVSFWARVSACRSSLACSNALCISVPFPFKTSVPRPNFVWQGGFHILQPDNFGMMLQGSSLFHW